MSTLRIAISGLHRGENPQPGSGILRSIRLAYPNAFIVGLVYDAMESGIYVENGPDAIYTMPYPTSGAEAFLARLDYVLGKTPVDLFIPTLDSEIELLSHLQDNLTGRGLLTCLPDPAMLKRRSKSRLHKLAGQCGVATPETRAVYDLESARVAGAALGYPLMVKGQYYDAHIIATEEELSAKTSKLLVQWGAPAILQRLIQGTEFNAMGLGDGEGEVIGLCCIRKTILSDKGKGLGGITIRDPKLQKAVTSLIGELKWRGPFEIETIKDERSGEHSLIEINPRFPAWVHFPSMFGINFPATLVEMMTTGRRPPTLPPCPAGHFYLRHQVEVLGSLHQLAELSTSRDFDAIPASVTSKISASLP